MKNPWCGFGRNPRALRIVRSGGHWLVAAFCGASWASIVQDGCLCERGWIRGTRLRCYRRIIWPDWTVVCVSAVCTDFFKNLKMVLVGGRVHNDIVDVHDDALDAMEDFFMRRWKEAGYPSKPMSEVTHSNCPWPWTVKAVRWLSFSSIGMLQNPEVRSMVAKMVDLASPMSL